MNMCASRWWPSKTLGSLNKYKGRKRRQCCNILFTWLLSLMRMRLRNYLWYYRYYWGGIERSPYPQLICSYLFYYCSSAQRLYLAIKCIRKDFCKNGKGTVICSILQYLISAQHNSNVHNGKTPFYMTCIEGQFDVVKLVLNSDF